MAREITKTELKELIQAALDEGLSTQEMADKFNTEFGDDTHKFTASDITKLKELVGLKGAKPKKKRSLPFVIVEEQSEDTLPFEEEPQQVPETEYEEAEEITQF